MAYPNHFQLYLSCASHIISCYSFQVHLFSAYPCFILFSLGLHSIICLVQLSTCIMLWSIPIRNKSIMTGLKLQVPHSSKVNIFKKVLNPLKIIQLHQIYILQFVYRKMFLKNLDGSLDVLQYFVGDIRIYWGINLLNLDA